MASGYNPEPVFAVFVDLVINNFSIRQNPFPVHEQDALIYKQNFIVGRLSQKEPISYHAKTVSVLFVFSHYLIMGGFFCITEKTFIPALQATGQCSQNVPPAGYLHQPVAGSCF